MSELTLIADQLRFAFEGPAWSGPSVMETLQGVTAAEASRRRAPNAHTIWELVLHIATWENVALRRLGGDPADNITAEEDYPPISDTSEQAWANAISRLQEGNRALRRAIAEFPPERLSSLAPGKDYSFYVLMHGVAQHDLYHAGQIAILKRI